MPPHNTAWLISEMAITEGRVQIWYDKEGGWHSSCDGLGHVDHTRKETLFQSLNSTYEHVKWVQEKRRQRDAYLARRDNLRGGSSVE
jgi:hypothetical protein